MQKSDKGDGDVKVDVKVDHKEDLYDIYSTPKQMDERIKQYDHWKTVATLIEAVILRWDGFEWCDFILPGNKKPERVTARVLLMLNRVLITAATEASKRDNNHITNEELLMMTINLKPNGYK